MFLMRMLFCLVGIWDILEQLPRDKGGPQHSVWPGTPDLPLTPSCGMTDRLHTTTTTSITELVFLP